MLAGLLMVTLAAASWGTWSLFIRPVHQSVLIIAPVIFLAMGLAALPSALRGARATWTRRSVLLVVGNAVCDSVNVLTFFAAMSYTTVQIAVLTHYLAPILIALAAPRVDGVSVRHAKPAAAVALVGLVIVLEPWHGADRGAIIGSLLGAASAVCYAANTFIVRRLTIAIGAARAVSYHALVAGVALLPFVLIAPVTHPVTLPDLALLAAGGASVGAIAGTLFALGVARIGSARTAILTYAEPIVAVIVGAVHWDEPVHAIALVGGALVLASGVHVARATR